VVGRKGKAGLEALALTLLTFHFQVLYESVEKHFQFLANACSFFYVQVKHSVSPSIMDIGEGLAHLDGEGSIASVSS
jgi:hypothetical protein